MKMRKILAVGIVLCMATASLSGCSMFSKFNKKKSKAIKAFKAIEYDKEDQDFMDELAEDSEDGEVIDVDGFYVEAESMKPLKTFFSEVESFKVKNATNCLMGGVSMGVGEDSDDECSWQYYLVEFVDEEKAEDFFDDYVDQMDEHYKQFKDQMDGVKDYLDEYELEFDDDDNRAQFFIHLSSDSMEKYMIASMDIILDGNTIEYIVAASPDKKAYKKISGDYESFYETLGIETPEAVLAD